MEVIDQKMILQEFLSPIDLFETRGFYIHEISLIVVFCKNDDLMLIIF